MTIGRSSLPIKVITPAPVKPKAIGAKSPKEPQRRPSKKFPFNVQTIQRDLGILESSLYHLGIRVNSGASRISRIDLQDFAPPATVMSVWNQLESARKPPQLVIFEELGDVIQLLTDERQALYKRYRIDLKVYQAIPGSRLAEALEAYDKLKALSSHKLAYVLEAFKEARDRFLFDEIKPLLEAGHCCDETTQRRLEVYSTRFPSLERIKARYGVSRVGPFKLNLTFESTTKIDAAKAQAEIAQAEAEAAASRLERDRLEAERELSLAQLSAAEREVRAAAWAHEEAQQLKLATAQELARQEQAAYTDSLTYQQTQVRSAIDEKVHELRYQVLQLLHHNLERVLQKDHQPGKVPPVTLSRLKELAQSAQVLTETDGSLAAVVSELNAFQTHAQASSTPDSHTALRFQVETLLSQINNALSPDDVITASELGSEDRSAWLDWD